MPSGVALLYDDEGADPFVTNSLARALAETGYDVRRTSACEVIGGDWHRGVDLLALPGGADRPYAAKLDGAGNASIRGFVERGGAFLGVCAGAYYACRRIDFVGREFAVKAPRELGLFGGTAVGSLPELAAAYRTGDLSCAAAARVTFDGGEAEALYWGGCCFVADEDADAEVIARYADLPPGRDTAAVACRVGDGRAVLVGVHAECRGDAFDVERLAYPDPNSLHANETARRLRESEAGRAMLFASLVRRLRA